HKILTNLAGSIILLLLPRIVQNKINKRYEILSEILPKIYKKEIEKTSKDEIKNLKKLFSKINSENVKDAIYAMSDGLVEVLSSISGLSGVFFNHLYVLIGGLIIGVSGTLSMTLGNFFSTLSEKEIEKNIDEKEKKQQVSQSTKITAIYYLIGAIIPLVSFIANFGKYSLIIAYILTGVAVFVVNYLIEFISERSNKQIIVRSTLITLLTLAIAYIIYILGNLIRYYIPSL
ncbi:MAG: VIT1/CCC1 transporter family protein, partial [Candidatus Rehaiarchaeum fermentans]|nr:VIT1/CCC1 transporter family protein [Candidatus Rehaiarchaeum fermentans]